MCSKKSLSFTILIAIIYWLVVRLMPIWERTPGGLWNVLFFLLIVILFFSLCGLFFIKLWALFSSPVSERRQHLYGFIAVIVSLSDIYFNPMKVDLDFIYGDVKLRACYEGTQNQATLKLRDNGEFDIHWTGAFFADKFYTGQYSYQANILELKFHGEIPRHLDDKLVVKEKYIYRVTEDGLKNTRFYKGYCLGLN